MVAIYQSSTLCTLICFHGRFSVVIAMASLLYIENNGQPDETDPSQLTDEAVPQLSDGLKYIEEFSLNASQT